MNNFMIGMFGGFDKNKLRRDFRKDFYGVEACLFDNRKELDELLVAIEGYKLGIHFPLIKNTYVCRDPLFLALDLEERKEAFEVFEKDLRIAEEISADYILVHFPKPVLRDKNLDWSCWRFGNNHEWIWEDEYPFNLFRSNCEEMFYRLEELSFRYNTRILLENDAYNKHLYESSILAEMLKQYSSIKLCIDTARLHLLESLDKDFCSKKFIDEYAKYSYLMHLSNTNIKTNTEGGHIPVAPYQKQEDGWADTEYYLKKVLNHNPEVKVLFEHRSELLSDNELQQCYNWVNEIYKEE